METATTVWPVGHNTKASFGSERVFIAPIRDMLVYGSFGVLLGIALIVGRVMVSAYDVTGDAARTWKTLTAENDVLRLQIGQYSTRIAELETQTGLLRASGDELHTLLHNSRVITNAGSRFTLATERPSHQVSVPVSIVFRASTMRGPK